MVQEEPTNETDREPIQRVAERLYQPSLKPLRPAEGLDLYLREKQTECAWTTLQTHESRLKPVIEYCREQGIENLNDLTGRILHEYRVWRREEGELSTVSEKHSQYTLKSFIRFLTSIEAVSPGLDEKVLVPSLSRGEGVRETIVEQNRINRILDYLEKYEYASRDHVIWTLFSRSGMRLGTLRGRDVRDFSPGKEPPRLEIRHRPGETPLKNQNHAERLVALTAETTEVIQDHLADHHPMVDDKYGRLPLIGTNQGRAADSTIRRCVYRWTRPCAVSRECPHGKDIEECQAASNGHATSKCPSSEAAHAVRRGYLTHELEEGVPMDILGDRADVTEPVLREWYDNRSEEQKMIQRKEIIETAHKEDTVDDL